MPDKRKKAGPISDAEEARVQEMIASDPDDWEATDEDFAKRVSPEEALPPGFLATVRRRGPGRKPKKEVVSIRLDPDVLAAYKAEGPGWQRRMNDTLRKAKKLPARA